MLNHKSKKTGNVRLKMKGRYIDTNKLFMEAERLLIEKGHRMAYNVLPLADEYCGEVGEKAMFMVSVGILVGIILERKKIGVECDLPVKKFETLFKLLKEFKERLDARVYNEKKFREGGF